MAGDAPGVICQVLYRSLARPGLALTDVGAILKISRRNNALSGITGLLVYREGCFLQMLEGPLGPVHSTLEKIKADSRHTDFEILYQNNAASEPLFKAWSMGYLDPAQPGSGEIAPRELLALCTGMLKQYPRVAPQKVKAIVSAFCEDCEDLSASLPDALSET